MDFVVQFLNSIQPITLVLSQIAVFATLIAIAYQIHMLRKSTCTSQYQTALQMLFNWRTDIIENPELAKRYEDVTFFKEVFKEHGEQSYFHTVKIFHVLEVFFLLRKSNVIEKDMWDAWEKQVEIIMAPVKNRDLWKKLKIL